MKNTNILLPIFAPDEYRADLNKKSITSLMEYVKKYDITDKCNFIFGGWASSEQILNSVLSEIVVKSEFLKFDKNYGKAFVVNKLFDFAKEKCATEYFLTCDSDIIFSSEEHNIFDRLEDACSHMIRHRNKQVGFISLNQSGNGQHAYNHMTHSYKYKNCIGNDEEIVYPDTFVGIAGGALYVNSDAFSKINGYRVMGVYSSDDAYLGMDMYNGGFSIQVSKTISIIHPKQADDGYAKWKHEKCGKSLSDGIRRDNIEEYIKDADSIWYK